MKIRDFFKLSNPILYIIIFSFIIKLFFLNIIPTGITNDELHFVLNAKAVYYNFSDMSDRWSPLSLNTIPDETSSELPFLLTAPLIGPLPTNLFTARFPYVLISLLTTLLIFLITKKLSNSHLAIIAVLVSLLNPWSFYTSRTSFDAPIALLFVLLFFYSLISFKKSKILFSLIPAVIFFNSYIGIKPLFIPIVFISSIFTYLFVYQKKYFKWLLILNLLSIFLFILYIFKVISSPGSQRLSELYTPSHPQIINLSEETINNTLSTPYTKLFINRYTVYVKYFLDKYINNFSPKILFSSGDPTYHVSLWQHGYFYYLDIPLIFLGLFFLFKKYPKFLLVNILFILLSPIPEAIRIDSVPAYAFHSSLQYPFFFILIAAGIYYLYILLKKFKPVFYLFSILYIFSFINFIFIYFFRYPYYQPEGFNFNQRLISEFISRQTTVSSKKITLISPEPDFAFRNYLFYTNQYQAKVYSKIASQYQKGRDTLSFNQITFSKDTKLINTNPNQIFIIQNDYIPIIPYDSKLIFLPQINNQNIKYTIWNSNLCPTQKISNHKFTLNDFDLSKLDNSQFCKLYYR